MIAIAATAGGQGCFSGRGGEQGRSRHEAEEQKECP